MIDARGDEIRKRTINGIVIVIILSILFYLAFIIFSGVEEVADAIRSFDMMYLAPILIIVFFAYLLRGLRWNYYLKKLGIKVSRREGLLLYFSGLSMLITPLMLSGAIKVGLIKARHGYSLSSTFPIVVVERITDLIGLLVFVLIGIWFFIGQPYVLGVTIFTIGFILTVIIVVRNKRLCKKFLKKLRKTRFGDKLKRPSREIYSTMYRLLTPRAISVASIISVCSWGLQGFALYLLFMGMGIKLDLLTTLFVFAFPLIFGIISQLPGGIGAEEGGMLGLMLVLGIEQGTSAASILLFRILTLWFGLIIGIITLKYFTSKYIHDKAKADTGGTG